VGMFFAGRAMSAVALILAPLSRQDPTPNGAP